MHIIIKIMWIIIIKIRSEKTYVILKIIEEIL